MKKILFLFLALMLPVLIFLFLRSFGKNEFDVPRLFTDSVTAPASCAAYAYQTPYVVADSILNIIGWNKNDSLTIVVFDDKSKVNKHERGIQIERVFSEFKTEPIQVVQVFNSSVILDFKRDVNFRDISLTENDFTVIRNCALLLDSTRDAVIIDRHKRIRGQYNLLKREDADRMIMQEMNILFKRY